MFFGVFDLNLSFIQSWIGIMCVPFVFASVLVHIRSGRCLVILLNSAFVVTLMIGVSVVLGDWMLLGLICQFISPRMLLALAIQLHCRVFLLDICLGKCMPIPGLLCVLAHFSALILITLLVIVLLFR